MQSKNRLGQDPVTAVCGGSSPLVSRPFVFFFGLTLSLVTHSLTGLALAQDQPRALELPNDPARRTETVRLIERCLPAVVSIRNIVPDEKPGQFRIAAGSGSIIHPAGFILTNYHVVRAFVRGEAILADGRVLPYQVVSAFPPEDLALIKVNVEAPLPTLPLGRSHDLMLGEPTLVIGNPDGLVQSVSTGIISGLGRAVSTADAFLPWMVQTTAAINGGNSGGPLVNAVGQQIGMITSKNLNADNIGFAIAVDRVRQMFPSMVAVEERGDFQLGLEVEMLTHDARVRSVAAGSPAETVAIKPGDVIRRVGPFQVSQGTEFYTSLIGRKAGDQVELEVARDAEIRTVNITLNPLPLMQPLNDEGFEAGIEFAAYQGSWTSLPAFETLTPAAKGIAKKIDLSAYGSGQDNFGLVFTGFVKLPADGLYAFFTKSDDGSQLRLGNRLIVENNGLHGAREAAGLVRMKAGIHPIEIRFFEAQGSESLVVSIEGPGLPKQELPEAMLLHKKPAAPAPDSKPDSNPEPKE